MLPPGTALYKHQHNGNNPMKKKEIHHHCSVKVIISIKEVLYVIKLCLCPNGWPIVVELKHN